MMRIGLRFEEWPEEDRAVWVALFRKGHPLDKAGPLAHYREASIVHLQNAYSYWLAWIRSEAPDLLLEAPPTRITAERLAAWRDTMSHLAPYSVSSLLQSLGQMLHALDRDRPTRMEKAVIHHAKARAERLGSERKLGRIVDTSVLLQAGLQHFGRHFGMMAADPKVALHCRDGLMIALLALMPMRRRPFAELDLGRSLRQTSSGWQVVLCEADLKAGASWESAVPSNLVGPLTAYVDQVRPTLAGRDHPISTHLWLTKDGSLMTQSYLGVRMKELTLRLIGRDVSCHLFRDCAATTLAITSPELARLTKSLLGHSTDTTATRYYNQATSLEAGRLLGACVKAIRKDN